MLSVDKIHKCKTYSLSTRTKTGFEYIFTENIYEISLCWEESLCNVSPMIIQGAWTRPMPGQPEENLLKSFSQTIYLQLCISIIHWNKYHVNLVWKDKNYLQKHPMEHCGASVFQQNPGHLTYWYLDKQNSKYLTYDVMW